MIDGSDFYKWVQVFGLTGGSGPPGDVSMQGAYDGGSDVVLADGKPINISDSASLVAQNIDPGSRKIRTEYTIEATQGGMTSHLLNQPVIDSRIITSTELDRVNVNYSTNGWNYTLPNDVSDSIPDGTQFEMLQIGASPGRLSLVWPAQVSINGIINGIITLDRPNERLMVRKVLKNIYTSVYFPNIANLAQQYTATITAISGIASVTASAPAIYKTNSFLPGGIVDIKLTAKMTSDNSGNLMAFNVSTPQLLPGNFTTTTQAYPGGFSITDNPDAPTGAGQGQFKKILSNAGGSGGVDLYFEAANTATDYVLYLSYSYVMQTASFAKKIRKNK